MTPKLHTTIAQGSIGSSELISANRARDVQLVSFKVQDVPIEAIQILRKGFPFGTLGEIARLLLIQKAYSGIARQQLEPIEVPVMPVEYSYVGQATPHDRAILKVSPEQVREKKAGITVGDLISLLHKFDPSMLIAIAYDEVDEVMTEPPRVEQRDNVPDGAVPSRYVSGRFVMI